MGLQVSTPKLIHHVRLQYYLIHDYHYLPLLSYHDLLHMSLQTCTGNPVQSGLLLKASRTMALLSLDSSLEKWIYKEVWMHCTSGHTIEYAGSSANLLSPLSGAFYLSCTLHLGFILSLLIEPLALKFFLGLLNSSFCFPSTVILICAFH